MVMGNWTKLSQAAAMRAAVATRFGGEGARADPDEQRRAALSDLIKMVWTNTDESERAAMRASFGTASAGPGAKDLRASVGRLHQRATGPGPRLPRHRSPAHEKPPRRPRHPATTGSSSRKNGGIIRLGRPRETYACWAERGTSSGLAVWTFRSKRGSFVAIMVRPASGKSTMLNILGCLDRPLPANIFSAARMSPG